LKIGPLYTKSNKFSSVVLHTFLLIGRVIREQYMTDCILLTIYSCTFATRTRVYYLNFSRHRV